MLNGEYSLIPEEDAMHEAAPSSALSTALLRKHGGASARNATTLEGMLNAVLSSSTHKQLQKVLGALGLEVTSNDLTELREQLRQHTA